MKVDTDSVAFKLAITPLLLAFFNVPALLVGLARPLGFPAYLPLLVLNAFLFLDLFTLKHSANKDQFNRALLALSFLGFPVLVAAPYLENLVLSNGRVTVSVLVAGTALEVLGGVLVIRSRRALGKFGAVDITLEDDHRLITDGPYAYVRNPIYSGFMALMAGYCVSVGGYLAGMLSLTILFGILRTRTLLEERLLEDRFSDEYRRYRDRVGRFLPRLRGR